MGYYWNKEGLNMPDKGDKVPLKTYSLICRDLDKTQARIKQIDNHFKDHYYLTRDDYEIIQREEYLAEIRRNLPEDEGAPVLDIEFIDLP